MSCKFEINEELLIYDHISYSSTGEFIGVTHHGKLGIINNELNRVVIPCKYETNCSIGEHVYINNCLTLGLWDKTIYLNSSDFKEIEHLRGKCIKFYFPESLYYAVDQKNSLVIYNELHQKEATYSMYDFIRDHAIIVQRYGDWGVIDLRFGKEVIPCKYERYKRISPNIIALSSKGKWGLIDLNTFDVVLPFEYSGFKACTGDLIPAQQGSKWGYLNVNTWDWALKPKYNDVTSFKGEWAAVALNDDKWRIIDKSGNKVMKAIFDRAYPIPGDLAIVWETWWKIDYRVINNKNETIYVGCSAWDDAINKRCLNVRSPGNGIGILDLETGKLKASCKYDGCYRQSIYDRYVRVSKNNKYGCYDSTMDLEAVPCNYDYCGAAYGGIFHIERSGSKGIYDSIYKRHIIPFNYDGIMPGIDNKSLAVRNGKLWGLLDRSTFKEVLPFIFNECKFISSDLLALSKDGKWGLFRTNGEQIDTRVLHKE